MLRSTSLFIVFLFGLTVKGQINIQWEARLNGDGNFIDKAVDLELDAAGNTYVTGSSYSGSSYQVVTVKYDSDGTEQWRADYGGTGIDEAHALVLDSNGDVIVTGSRFISGTDWDIITVKYDGTTGAELWAVINPGSAQFDSGVDVAVDGSDNVLVLGSRTGGSMGDTDFLTLKYTPAGSFIWARALGGTGNDLPKVIQVDASDNIYVAGHREFAVASTYFDFYVAKYDAAGTLQWSKTEDSGFGKLDTPYAMTLDAAGDIILGGSGFTDILNEEDYLTMKFANATGALIWKRTYAGDAEGLDVINAVVTDAANNVYVTGKSKSSANSEDFYTIAYNSAGTEIWAERYTTPGLRYDEAKDIRISDSDLSIYITGYSFYPTTNNDFTTIKYNAADGVQEWVTIFNGPSSNSDQALRMKLDPSENIFITGNSHGGSTNLDYSTIKYCQLTTTASSDTSVCDGGSVDLTATGGEDVTWAVLSGDFGSMSCTLCETMTATPDVTTVYIVSSESLSGCVDYDTVLVEVNPIPTLAIYNDTPLDFCLGGSVTLYTDTYAVYDWSTGDVDSFAVVTDAGTVSLTVIDENGCTNTTSAEVSTYDLPVISVGDDLSVCPGESVVLNATGGVTYAWDPNPTLSSLIIPNPTASPVTDTEYKVTGTDDNGCQNRDSLFVFVYDLPVVSAGSDETVCLGDSVSLLATGATSYVWDAHPTLSDLLIPNPWASPTTLTEYFVTGTDDNGCVNRDSVNVSVLASPDISAGLDTAVCAGGSVQLFASGGLADMYIWNDDPTLSETDVFDPFASPLTGTNYIVEGTDINGCSNTDTVFVAVYALPLVNAGPDENVCMGDSVHLNATGGISYVWDSHPSLSDLDIPNPWASPIASHTYTVTAEDANGCVNSDDVTVSVIPPPAISAGSDVSICEGDSTQLNASGGVIYVWDFDPTLSNFLIGDPWASPVVTTTYIVEGTDAFGCSNTDEVTVSVNPTPTAPVLTREDIYIISSIPVGNQWYHESGELVGETNDSLNYVEIGLNGEYWVVFTDEFGCSVESDRIDNAIFITDVSIVENQTSFNVQVYPNPAHDLLNIAFDGEMDQIRILTLDGKEVYRDTNVQPGIYQVGLNDLSAGTYLIQLVKDGNMVVKKLVKN